MLLTKVAYGLQHPKWRFHLLTDALSYNTSLWSVRHFLLVCRLSAELGEADEEGEVGGVPVGVDPDPGRHHVLHRDLGTVTTYMMGGRVGEGGVGPLVPRLHPLVGPLVLAAVLAGVRLG